jgi:hypothetical protein
VLDKAEKDLGGEGIGKGRLLISCRADRCILVSRAPMPKHGETMLGNFDKISCDGL